MPINRDGTAIWTARRPKAGNSRNGYGRKTLLTDSGKLPISVPRDRLTTFDRPGAVLRPQEGQGLNLREASNIRMVRLEVAP